MAESSSFQELEALRATLIKKFDAGRLKESPYQNSALRIDRARYLELAQSLNPTARVFYLGDYLNQAQIPRLITHIPYICTGGDRCIILQNLANHRDLPTARQAMPSLLTNEERRISRKKSIASFVKVFARGGYHSRLEILHPSEFFDCVVVSGAGPQFEAQYLDYADLLVSRPEGGKPVCSKRLPAFESFGDIPASWDTIQAKAVSLEDVLTKHFSRQENTLEYKRLPDFVRIGESALVLHITAYMHTMRECIHLWLTAFDTLVASRTSRCAGYFKLVAIGTGFFADVSGSGGVNIGSILMPLLLRATIQVLESVRYPHINTIEFPDFSGKGLYSHPVGLSKVNGISLASSEYCDLLEFPAKVKEQNLVPGVLNPGDCFAFVGNETSYGSVEAMIGCNTTLRVNQNYVWNERVLDRFAHHPVQLPQSKLKDRA